jgi:hypothetical protein
VADGPSVTLDLRSEYVYVSNLLNAVVKPSEENEESKWSLNRAHRVLVKDGPNPACRIPERLNVLARNHIMNMKHVSNIGRGDERHRLGYVPDPRNLTAQFRLDRSFPLGQDSPPVVFIATARLPPDGHFRAHSTWSSLPSGVNMPGLANSSELTGSGGFLLGVPTRGSVLPSNSPVE